MKKILLLGGSAQQIVAIQTAKELGYQTILCDFLPDNPGQYVADKFYLVSTTDKEAILNVAIDEQIDGILAYASDPAAPTAAYVAKKLGLPGNPYESVEILCNKDKFRKFLKEQNFCAPEARGYTDSEQSIKDIKENVFCFPIIIKPVDSSGSKGVSVLESQEGVNEAVKYAFSFSRGHRIVVEEFIEKKHAYLIGGDIFIVDGKIALWGLLNCHRDSKANPLVPVGKSYPLEMDDYNIQQVKETLQTLVDKLKLRSGAMNVELIIDKNNNVWPIDVGPRAGGNMIPDLLGLIFDVDVVEMAIKAAMGVEIDNEINSGINYYATHNLHAIKEGIYEDILFSEEINKYIVKKYLYKKNGDKVEFFDNASKALGIIFMKFNNQTEMNTILRNINDNYTVSLR